jgi:hypothetical protein
VRLRAAEQVALRGINVALLLSLNLDIERAMKRSR